MWLSYGWKRRPRHAPACSSVAARPTSWGLYLGGGGARRARNVGAGERPGNLLSGPEAIGGPSAKPVPRRPGRAAHRTQPAARPPGAARGAAARQRVCGAGSKSGPRAPARPCAHSTIFAKGRSSGWYPYMGSARTSETDATRCRARPRGCCCCCCCCCWWWWWWGGRPGAPPSGGGAAPGADDSARAASTDAARRRRNAPAAWRRRGQGRRGAGLAGDTDWGPHGTHHAPSRGLPRRVQSLGGVAPSSGVRMQGGAPSAASLGRSSSYGT
jgi:streptolysin S family bacteriocin protoxin